jgi:hypothetical protein
LDKDKSPEIEVVYDKQEKQKTPERGIPKDVLGKFEEQSKQKAIKEEGERILTGSPVKVEEPQPKPLVIDPQVPFVKRPFKMHVMREFLT